MVFKALTDRRSLEEIRAGEHSEVFSSLTELYMQKTRFGTEVTDVINDVTFSFTAVENEEDSRIDCFVLTLSSGSGGLTFPTMDGKVKLIKYTIHKNAKESSIHAISSDNERDGVKLVPHGDKERAFWNATSDLNEAGGYLKEILLGKVAGS